MPTHYHPAYLGYKLIAKSYYSKLKRMAIQRNLQFKISMKDMWLQFEKQAGICALSKEPIFLTVTETKRAELQTASLDRKDSSKDYTKDNIQWIHKSINKMKWNFTEDKFKYWCKLIVENYENINS